MPYSEQKYTLSHHTNYEKQVASANPDDPTTTTPEQDDTTLENPSNSPPIPFATNETNERDGIVFPTGDFPGTDSADEYRPGPRARSSSSSSSSGNSSSSDTPAENINSNNETPFHENNQPAKPITKPRGRKRTRNPTKWKKNVAKRLRNSGQSYISVKTKKLNQAKTMGPTCTSKCRLSCAAKFTEQKRSEIFESYWKLESLERQRGFLNACTRTLKCAYRRIKTNKMYDRKENTAYYLLNENKEIRVCKTFLINTVGITQRIIRTVIDGKARNDGFIPPDQRGKHGKQCKLQPKVIQAEKDHVAKFTEFENEAVKLSTGTKKVSSSSTVKNAWKYTPQITKKIKLTAKDQLQEDVKIELQQENSTNESSKSEPLNDSDIESNGSAYNESVNSDPLEEPKIVSINDSESHPEMGIFQNLSEYEAVGINVGKKLSKMDPTQALYAESIINHVLRKGLLNKLKDATDLCDGRCGSQQW